MALRAMPNVAMVRPADPNETVEAWRWALTQRTRPVGLVLTRQKVPVLDRSHVAAGTGLARGAYVLADADNGAPNVILIATGSEVSLAVAARDLLARDGIGARVVSMPCWEAFEEQDQAYRDAVLPPSVRARVSVEAGATFGWHRWIGDGGVAIGIDRFGASAPGEVNLEKFGFTAEHVSRAARELVRRRS
jgi:transketolase